MVNILITQRQQDSSKSNQSLLKEDSTLKENVKLHNKREDNQKEAN